MRSYTISLSLAFVLLICSNASAQSPDTSEKIQLVERGLIKVTQTEGETPATIQERMAHYHVKGVSIAVIHNYKMEWAKGYGWADESLRIPVTVQTLFQAASISKSLNSVGVLKLVQDKKIDLYADINNYLHLYNGKQLKSMGSYMLMNGDQLSWRFPYDSLSNNKKISIANLLSHTGGLTVHGFGGYELGKDLPGVAQILDGKPPANSAPVRSMYEPGLKYEYSGGGITISQLIVINTTHQPYDKYMYENVLEPLGMTGSTYALFPSGDIKPLLAAAYYADGSVVPGKHHIYPEQAAAGLWTNPTDLSKYIIETQLAYEGRSHKVLNQQTTKLRLTPYMNKDAALGVFIDNLDSTQYFEHGGSNEGFRSQYYGSLEDGNGLVIMVNSDNGDIIPEIVNSIAKVYGFKSLYHSRIIKAFAITDTVLQSYTGKYELKPGFIIEITRKGNQLYGQATGQQRFSLSPETQGKFAVSVADIEIEFIKDDTGKVVKAVIYQNGPHEAKKIE